MFSFLSSTYLIERLFGVGTYVALLLIFCNIIGSCKRTNVKRWLVVYATILAVLAFFYVPGANADLVSLTSYMHSWSAQSPRWLIESMSASSTPTYVLYFWLIGKLGIDGLLPAVTTFLGMLFLFAPIGNLARRADVKQSVLPWILALMMCFGILMGFASNIRNGLAFSMIFWCWYKEAFEEKSVLLHLPLYVIGGLMHSAALALVALRLALLIAQPQQTLGKRFIYLLGVVLVVLFVMRSGSAWWDGMMEKGTNYLSNGGYSYVWQYLLHIIMLAYTVYVLFVGRRCRCYSVGAKRFRQAAIVMSVGLFVFLPLSYAAFTRFCDFVFFVIAIVAGETLNDDDVTVYAPRFGSITAAAVVICLALSVTRGNLSGFKYFLIEG